MVRGSRAAGRLSAGAAAALAAAAILAWLWPDAALAAPRSRAAHKASRPAPAPVTQLRGGCVELGSPPQPVDDSGAASGAWLSAVAAPARSRPGRHDARCRPYLASVQVLGRERRLQAAAVRPAPAPSGTEELLLVSRDGGLGPLRSAVLDVTDELQDLVFLERPLLGLLDSDPDAVLGLPAEIQGASSNLAARIADAHPELRIRDDLLARLAYLAGDELRQPRLLGAQVLSPGGTVLADALWVDRDDIPGGFFSSSLKSYERGLWTHPLSYTRISRGIGTFVTRTTKRVLRRRRGREYTATVHVRHRGKHKGIDFAAPTGTPVYAAADGRVGRVGPNGGFGNLVVLEHPGSYETYYAHLSAFADGLSEGDLVLRGQLIGFVGSTGLSTGPHLHFELHRGGQYLNVSSSKLELDLWQLRPRDQVQLLRQCLVLGWCDDAAAASAVRRAAGDARAPADAVPETPPAAE